MNKKTVALTEEQYKEIVSTMRNVVVLMELSMMDSFILMKMM